MDTNLVLDALKTARGALNEALGDLTDHFTIKHIKGDLETVQEAIDYIEQTQP